MSPHERNALGIQHTPFDDLRLGDRSTSAHHND